MTKVSVIIACFNAAEYIGECLDSLLNQTMEDIEIIVCDDASTDGSLNILEEYARKDSRIVLICNDCNIYAAATRNKCLEISSGKYIAIQDADDLSEPDRIEKLSAVLDSDTSISFVSSGMSCFENDPIHDKNEAKVIEYPTRWNFLRRLPFSHGATMFRKDCLIDVGGYRVSPETRRGQDYDLFMRLYSKGYRGKNISDKLYLCRVDKDNIRRRKFEYRLTECKIRYKGFCAMRLMPFGLPFVFRPLLAHFVQLIRYRRYYKKA